MLTFPAGSAVRALTIRAASAGRPAPAGRAGSARPRRLRQPRAQRGPADGSPITSIRRGVERALTGVGGSGDDAEVRG